VAAQAAALLVHKVAPVNRAVRVRIRAAVKAARVHPAVQAEVRERAAIPVGLVQMPAAKAAAAKEVLAQVAAKLEALQQAAHRAVVAPRSPRLVFHLQALVDHPRRACRIRALVCPARVADLGVQLAVNRVIQPRSLRARAAAIRQAKAFSPARAAVRRDQAAAHRDQTADSPGQVAVCPVRKVVQPDPRAELPALRAAVKLVARLQTRAAEECKGAARRRMQAAKRVVQAGAVEQPAVQMRAAEECRVAARRPMRAAKWVARAGAVGRPVAAKLRAACPAAEQVALADCLRQEAVPELVQQAVAGERVAPVKAVPRQADLQAEAVLAVAGR
jgi:hypothetical protein